MFDDGLERYCSKEQCAHLGGDWKFEEIDDEDIVMDTNKETAYQEIIDYLPAAKQEELLGIALEVAKSNPVFFMNALKVVKSRGLSNLAALLKDDKVEPLASTIYKFSNVSGGVDRSDFVALVLQCLQDDKKINAIKRLREISATPANDRGYGLKEAKDIIDSVMHSAAWCATPHEIKRALNSMMDSNGVIRIP